MPADLKKTRELFLHAVGKLPPDEWAGYVAEACGEDAELEQQVGRLLQVHREAGSFLDQPAAVAVTGKFASELGAGATAVPLLERPGTVIGPYKLLQQIGEGGMGAVYMAEQTQPVHRKVALKLIKAGMDTRQVIARFEQERQALALMDHPNVAKVLDAGTTDMGRPYFVMELVKGVPITNYCDDHHLTPKQRLELFVPVCQAVQHAHQKGVIHRDLKPTNVLVCLYDGRPVPKVIDFGVAKATGQKLTERTMFTEIGQVVGTLEYMSPEQAELNQLDVDTRCDIYSLGVLLYELLTGTTPLERNRMKQVAMLELLRLVREEEAPRPSTRLSTTDGLPSIAANRGTEPKKLSGMIRGELDWIVLKALEKDRSRRYDTPNGLAHDIERYLNDETVLACPPSAIYRLRKFVRRNRASLAIATVFLSGVLVAVVGLAVNYALVTRQKEQKEAALERAAQQKTRADQNLARAREAVKDFLTKTADNQLLKEADFHDLRRELLESAIPFYLEFVKQEAADAELEAERGRAYGDLALLHEGLGQLDQALADHDQRRAIFERLSEAIPGQPGYRQELANSYRSLANVHHWLNQSAKAEAAYRGAITILGELTAQNPASGPYRADLAGACGNLAVALRALGRLDETMALNKRALGIRERLVAEFPKIPTRRRDLAQSHANLGLLFMALGQHDNALASIQRAAELFEKLSNEFPTTTEYRGSWANTLNSKSVMLCELGRREEGLTAQQQALQIQEKLAADFLSLPGYRRDVAESRVNLGELLMELGRNQESLASLDLAVSDLDRLLQRSPENAENRQAMALACNNRGLTLRKLDQRAEALDAYRKAQALQEKLVADFPAALRFAEDLGRTYNNIGDLLNDLGRLDDAITALDKAISLREKLARDHVAVPAYAVDLGAAYLNMGVSKSERNQCKDALDWFTKALSVVGPILSRDPRLVEARALACNIHAARAQALDRLGRPSEAVHEFDEALALDEGQQRLAIRLARAGALVRSGDHARASADADAIAGDPQATAHSVYDSACIYALCAATARGDAPQNQRYATRAVRLLQQAIARGYKDVQHLKKDTDLDALRSRADFGKVIADLEHKAK
jgi:serine/threonine protein kinase/tetratricopeptide (TPR) repeat protein